MRTLLIALTVLLLLLAASAKDKQMTGWITDASCASKPEAVTAEHEACAKKCASSGQLVFVSESDKKVWNVENPGFLKGLEGQRVSVTGAADNGKSMLRIKSVMQ